MRTAFVSPKFEPSHFESEFSNLSQQVMSASEPRQAAIDECLRDCDAAGITDDTTFVSQMKDVEVKDNKKAKRLLLGLNSHLQSDGHLMPDIHYSVEHILPQSKAHWDGWQAFDPDEPKFWVHRIGNLTILARRDNKPSIADNRDFEKKRQAYGESAIKLSRDLAKYTEWSPAAITRRQSRLASMAKLVWSFEWRAKKGGSSHD